MSAANLLNTKAVAYGVAIVVGSAVVYFVANKILSAVAENSDKVNPTSDQNIAYQGVNAVGAAVSGNSSWSLGSWIYDITHPGEGEMIRSTPPYQPRKLAVREESKVFDWLTNNG